MESGDAYRRAIGRTISALRAEHGWSLRALSDRSGLSLAYLSELEHGRKEPSGATLEQLADAFGLALAGMLAAIARTIEGRELPTQELLRDLDPAELAELARFADWLRWRREHR